MKTYGKSEVDSYTLTYEMGGFEFLAECAGALLQDLHSGRPLRSWNKGIGRSTHSGVQMTNAESKSGNPDAKW